jgi:hypothetical protein
MDRTLRLRRETLTELTDRELDLVGGGDPQPTPPQYLLTFGPKPCLPTCPTLTC